MVYPAISLAGYCTHVLLVKLLTVIYFGVAIVATFCLFLLEVLPTLLYMTGKLRWLKNLNVSSAGSCLCGLSIYWLVAPPPPLVTTA